MSLASNQSYTAVLTSFNAEKTISSAVNSILMQKILPKEIIIVDDCSTDGTNAILDSFSSISNVKLFKNQENYGQSYSRNLAVEASSCEFAIIFDDDDVSLPERSQQHLEMFLNGSIFNFVSSMKHYGNGVVTKSHNSDSSFQIISVVDAVMKILVGGEINGVSDLNIPASASAFKVSEFKLIGGYDRDFRRLEDAEIFIKACANNLPMSWTSKVGVVRNSTVSPEKGGSLESNFEKRILTKYEGFLTESEFSKCAFQIELRRHYFDRNATKILKLLLTNPLQTLVNAQKIKSFAKRVLHDLRISGSS